MHNRVESVSVFGVSVCVACAKFEEKNSLLILSFRSSAYARSRSRERTTIAGMYRDRRSSDTLADKHLFAPTFFSLYLQRASDWTAEKKEIRMQEQKKAKQTPIKQHNNIIFIVIYLTVSFARVYRRAILIAINIVELAFFRSLPALFPPAICDF